MLKYIIYIAVGYLIFKVVKNGVHLVIENLQKPKELKGTTELVKCDQCGGFSTAADMIYQDGKALCSESCKRNFLNEQAE